MAEFQVTASTLKQKAEELSTLNNNFAKKRVNLKKYVKKCNNIVRIVKF